MNTEHNFPTLKQAHGKDAVYFGNKPNWLVAFVHVRDSDLVTESNWNVFVESLPEAEIERSSHWAVGWVEYLVVAPDDEKSIKRAMELTDRLEDHPVLDDVDLSRREWEAYEQAWDDWGRDEVLKGFVKALEPITGEIFAHDEICDAVLELDSETVDKACADLNLNWLYQPDGDGVTINVKGIIDALSWESLVEPAIENLKAAQRDADIRKLALACGACEAQAKEAVKMGLDRVTSIYQLMQGMI